MLSRLANTSRYIAQRQMPQFVGNLFKPNQIRGFTSIQNIQGLYAKFGKRLFSTEGLKNEPNQAKAKAEPNKKAEKKKNKANDKDDILDDEPIDYGELRIKPSLPAKIFTYVFFASIITYIASYVAYKYNVLPKTGNRILSNF